MLSKFRVAKNSLTKWFVTAMVVASMAAMSCMTCFAAEESTVDMSETIRSAFATMQSDLVGYIAIVLPIGLTIFGTYWGIQKAIKFFKKTSN